MTSMVLIRCCNNPYRVDIDVRTHEKRFNLPDSGGDIVVGYTFSSRLCCMLFVHVFFKLPESYYWWNTQNIVCVVFVPFVFFLFVAHFVRRKILNDFFDLPHLHSRFAALSHNRLHIYTQKLMCVHVCNRWPLVNNMSMIMYGSFFIIVVQLKFVLPELWFHLTICCVLFRFQR